MPWEHKDTKASYIINLIVNNITIHYLYQTHVIMTE